MRYNQNMNHIGFGRGQRLSEVTAGENKEFLKSVCKHDIKDYSNDEQFFYICIYINHIERSYLRSQEVKCDIRKNNCL